MARKDIEKRRAYDRAWHRKHREDRIRVQMERQRAVVAWVQTFKKECERCGFSEDVTALDFHHLRDDKVGSVAALAHRGWGKEKLKAEMEKCQILCANCHRIVHKPR